MDEPSTVMAGESGIGFLLSQAARAIARDLQARLQPYGITPAQLCVLTCLWEEDGLSGSALAERAGFDPPTITGILDRLERQELLVRRRSPDDRRVVITHLTERGSALREALPRIERDNRSAALAGLDDAQVSALRAALERILRNVA